jgi:hypothetical protein
MDKKTEQIAAEWVAKYDAALAAGDLAEMERIVNAVCASPNQPFRRAMCKALAV